MRKPEGIITMNKRISRNYIKSVFIAIALIVSAGGAWAQKHETLTPETQNTESMTYQGRLMNAGVPANGTYDFQFKVTSSDGTVLQTVEALGVPVNNGIFTARFSVNVSIFAGAIGPTFMSVGVRQLPTEPYTPLAPSQPISATPLAFKSHYATQAGNAANADMLGGISPNQFVQSDDYRLINAREPLPGSENYIQNQNFETPQAAYFNITGTGSANSFNARSSFQIDGLKMLAAPGFGNIFVGLGAGDSNTSGFDNTFYGRDAGFSSTTASGNSFFGADAGRRTTVAGNSFFGYQSGTANTTGAENAFFGTATGTYNQTGFRNTFVGFEAGNANNVGSTNTFIGFASGKASTNGTNNTFVGSSSGNSNLTGSQNVFVGDGAGYLNTLGVGNVFIGSTAGYSMEAGNRNVLIGNEVAFANTTGNDNVVIGSKAKFASGVSNSVAIGASAVATLSNQIVLGTSSQNTFVSGNLTIASYPSGGSVSLCANPTTNIVSLCSSSQRFKDNIAGFTGGLDLVKKLRPVSFTWKDGGVRDVGFVAEEVADVEPLLASRDASGVVQGVKYDRISTALVNAVNQQQAQIESLRTLVDDQQKQLQKQQQQIDALKQIVCGANAAAAICKEKE